MRTISRRLRSQVSRLGLCCNVTVHITLKPHPLMASDDASLARVGDIAGRRFSGQHIDLLAIGRQEKPPISLSRAM